MVGKERMVLPGDGINQEMVLTRGWITTQTTLELTYY